MNYTQHDRIFQTTCPTVMVPKFGTFEPLEKPGQRYLAAADGLWIEICRPWLTLIWPVALQDAFAMPYGSLEKKVELAFGRIPSGLIDQFLADAKATFPSEFGAWLIWDDDRKELVYRPLRSIEANGGYLKAARPTLDDHESLAVDLHSHGRYPAFFSPKDDKDDCNEVKLSGVYGSLDQDEVTTAFRLCTGGKFIEISSEQGTKE